VLEIPVDFQRAEVEVPTLSNPVAAEPVLPADNDVKRLTERLTRWKRPVLLAGGGVLSSGATSELRELAHRLGAPVFHTAMGMSTFPGDDPLNARMAWQRATSDLTAMEQFFSPMFAEADGLLAVGCRFTQLTTGSWALKLPDEIAQIDVDPTELGRHYPLACGVAGDARRTLERVLALLPDEKRSPWALPQRPVERWQLPGIDILGPLRRLLPRDGVVVADITRLAYIMMVEFPVYEPRTFLHPAGYVSMGYGIPAALGARAAFPRRPVVVVVGDGCFLMSGMELATAIQEDLPIVIVLINDRTLTLIKSTQERRYGSRFIGVDLRNPNFGQFAQSFGVRHRAVSDTADFEDALREALGRTDTTLLEVQLTG
jgi:acetolactate synthase-1/2/3 large subunit